MEGASTVYCYLTDGRNSQDLREASYRSLTYFCGDVPVYVCTLTDTYKNPRKWENLVDIRRTFREVFGGDSRPEDLILDAAHIPKDAPYDPGWRYILLAKLALPFFPEFSGFKNIVFVDDDIEVLTPEFGRLPELCPLAPFADLAAGVTPHYMYMSGHWSYEVGLHGVGSYFRDKVPPEIPHLNAGIILHRTRGTDGFLSRLRRVYTEIKSHPERYFFNPEETPMTLMLHTQVLPLNLSTIQNAPEINRYGAGDILASAVMTRHYSSKRKKSKVCKDFISRYLKGRN